MYANGPALLTHRRLSIIDLSTAGNQPISNADGSVHIVFNGEIYNYRELRERMSEYSFRSETDTEVLLHLYEQDGVDCLDLLRGMFAVAIWDEDRERLFLARDRLGQKPLFYHCSENTIWFGSTIQSILTDDDVPTRPDLQAIRKYLTYQYVPHPRTGFKGIRQLEPGEYAVFDSDGIQKDSFWRLSYADQFTASPDALADRLHEQLREATRLRMRSDVPVGVFLSGGIDSSVVTALMDDISDRPVSTYSIGFDEDSYDELSYAREVADVFDTDHNEYTVTPDSMEVLPEIVEHSEMPFGDPSMLPTYYVSEVAADDVTVALSGDAGDENFAGYDRYRWDRTMSRMATLPQSVNRTVATLLALLPEPVRSRQTVKYACRMFDAVARDEVGRYADFICHAMGSDVDEVWEGETPDDELAALRTAFDHADGPTRLDQLMQVDMATYLPNDLLFKLDRASMAHSLEVRSPFLDHEFIQFAARIPSEYKLRNGMQKWLMKRAFEDILPDGVLTREKQGFGVPLDDWFRGELRDYARDRLEALESRSSFSEKGATNVLHEHVHGKSDNGYRIWDLIMLEAWFERFIDD